MNIESFPLPLSSKSAISDVYPLSGDDDDIGNTSDQDNESTQCTDSEISPPVIVDKSGLIFYVEFANGYTFRQFVEFVKRVSKQLPLAFSQKGITTAICSSTRQMIVNSVFRREDLTRFDVNKDAVNMPSVESDWYHIVNIDTSELFDQIRAVAKKDGVRLMQRVDRPDSIQVQIFGPKTDGGTSNIRVKRYSPISYSVTEPNRRPSTYPNVTIQLSRFCSCLSGLIKARYSKVAMRIFQSGVTILGATATGSSTRGSTFGEIPAGVSPTGQTISDICTTSSDDPEFFQISLASPTVHSLVKLINFYTEGVVRIYCSSSSIVRIETSLGCYGSIRVYLGVTRQDLGRPSKTISSKKDKDASTNKTDTDITPTTHSTKMRMKRLDDTAVIDLRK